MRVVVLGAGLAGVSSAWYLAQAGHEVTVVDRQPDAGMETSFANGGQISVSHPEPWANPGAPAQILKWLGREDAPLLFRLRADPRQWAWGLNFLWQCLPANTRRNTDAIARLALYSRAKLRELRRATGIEYDCQTRGILHLYFDEREFAEVEPRAAQLRGYGMRVEVLDASGTIRVEPALAGCGDRLVGALYAPDDESGDACKFAQGLAALCADRGVELRFNTRIDALEAAGGLVTGVRVTAAEGRSDTIEADACVVALGSHSPLLVKPLGESLAVYPVKGYSVTLPVACPELAPSVSVTDESRRIVASRLGERLRFAGTAELGGYDTSLNRARCQAILRRAQELFPGAGDASRAQFWAGLRPATPSNLPVIGRGRLANLFYNTGHGTLGWTLACGSGQAIAQIVSGLRPEVDFPFRGLVKG